MKHWALTTFVNLANKRLKGDETDETGSETEPNLCKDGHEITNPMNPMVCIRELFYFLFFPSDFRLDSSGARLAGGLEEKAFFFLNPAPPLPACLCLRRADIRFVNCCYSEHCTSNWSEFVLPTDVPSLNQLPVDSRFYFSLTWFWLILVYFHFRFLVGDRSTANVVFFILFSDSSSFVNILIHTKGLFIQVMSG